MAAALFSETWMRDFAEFWNRDEQMVSTLAEHNFSAKIGYGFIHDNPATGLLVVKDGKAVAARIYQAEVLDWDLRGEAEDWRDWLEKGLGLDRFGFVIAHKKLQFKAGDPRAMMRAPALGCAFLRSFELMGKIKTKWK